MYLSCEIRANARLYAPGRRKKAPLWAWCNIRDRGHSVIEFASGSGLQAGNRAEYFADHRICAQRTGIAVESVENIAS